MERRYNSDKRVIQWDMRKPLSAAYLTIDEHFNKTSIPESMMNKKMNIQEGDVVCLFTKRGEITCIQEKIASGSTTLKDILKTIEKGMRRPMKRLSKEDYDEVNEFIKFFYVLPEYEKLKKKLDAGTLKPMDLLEEINTYGGSLVRRKDGIWTFQIMD